MRVHRDGRESAVHVLAPQAQDYSIVAVCCERLDHSELSATGWKDARAPS